LFPATIVCRVKCFHTRILFDDIKFVCVSAFRAASEMTYMYIVSSGALNFTHPSILLSVQ